MSNYYKGKIINIHNLKIYSYVLDLIKSDNEFYTRNISLALESLSKNKNCIGKKEIDRTIIEMFNPTPGSEIGKPIIYKKIYDNEGNIYGQDLVTNFYFPIKNDYSKYNISYYKQNTKHLYLDKESGNIYSNRCNEALNTYYIKDDVLELELHIPQEEQSKAFRMLVGDEIEVMINGKKIRITCVVPNSYKIDIKPEMIFPGDKRINYAISNESEANVIEVKNYFDEFEKGFGKRKRRKDYTYSLENLFVKNKLGNITFKEEKELVKVKKI